ncbi:RrF2 family transcriptional regulator [Magnetospirillum moscoviense]|uniref:Rrf2 family transcriptional regulator n=1 Tax=Magnetospirillum moscoviense TaxID=1437059 RepID=A0A178N070_9PROT|nr:Rrf2 family transcriptional regulator [Magnetospirillum moscoviense]MBF0324444.1 Rrf2 family transcriptional regulator [Alphaproteobacteria bacterium]OAN67040.1 Rrf2 family transcriptional regulator [Magnetospirillum moscoviense]
MRLTLHTDYALRVLVHVGLRPGALTTINDIAAEHAISKNHLTKVVHQLGRAGYLETVRGKYGGVRLRVDAASIRIGQLVRQVEDDFALARCMRDAPDEACLLDSSCVARHAFSEGLDAFFTSLDRYTLADMIQAERGKPNCKAACG